MLVDWINALKVVRCSLDLFGQPVIAHLGIPRSSPAHVQNLSSLLSCVCSVSSLLAIVARSSAYAADEIFTYMCQKCIHYFLVVAILSEMCVCCCSVFVVFLRSNLSTFVSVAILSWPRADLQFCRVDSKFLISNDFLISLDNLFVWSRLFLVFFAIRSWLFADPRFLISNSFSASLRCLFVFKRLLRLFFSSIPPSWLRVDFLLHRVALVFSNFSISHVCLAETSRILHLLVAVTLRWLRGDFLLRRVSLGSVWIQGRGLGLYGSLCDVCSAVLCGIGVGLSLNRLCVFSQILVLMLKCPYVAGVLLLGLYWIYVYHYNANVTRMFIYIHRICDYIALI